MTHIEKVIEVRKLYLECCEYNFDGMEVINNYNDEELAEIWNGIGSQKWSPLIRKIFDSLHPSLKPVAFLHDIQYEYGGEEKDFTKANDLFKSNGKRIAFGKFKWYDPRRYLVMNKARQFGNVCQMFGKENFNFNLKGK